MPPKDLERFIGLLGTQDHRHAVPLYDALAKDPSTAAPILRGLVFEISKHDDPQLHTPHGLLTAVAGRDLLRLTHPPGGLGLLRFLVLYNFTLPKSPTTAQTAEALARGIPPATADDLAITYRKAVFGGLGDRAGQLLCRIVLDQGAEAAAHVALQMSLNDVGRLGHNLVIASAYIRAAEAMAPPEHLVPLARLAQLQAISLSGARQASIPGPEGRSAEDADVKLLEDLVVEGSFDRVEGVLIALASAGRAEEAYGPLLVAASADPGFLGHSLDLVHHARLASCYLTPSENAFLLWKLYRTLTSRFGYPEFLELGAGPSMDRSSLLNALGASLRFKSPPIEATIRGCLESGVPLEDVLATVVDAYATWSVGEKDHTISYLNAALQTAKFLGKDRALLPMTIALSKLPF